MFTGIVEELGTVAAINVNSSGGRLTLNAPMVSQGLRVDESVATNGVCLTAVAVNEPRLEVDLAPETLSRTNLGALQPGDRVCLERSVTLQTRMGGHLVQGHIDGTATIVEVEPEGIQRTMRFEAGPEIMRYVVAKGFVALDGVSLTVVDCDASGFSIALIPHSADLTTLGFKRVGDRVNVEVDMIAKYVERFVEARANA
ncbi:MAG TPA: riboflavin synthase [Chloroflexota bacterium]|nr:riboflavin synthase [Chloroflexota bacterium]